MSCDRAWRPRPAPPPRDRAAPRPWAATTSTETVARRAGYRPLHRAAPAGQHPRDPAGELQPRARDALPTAPRTIESIASSTTCAAPKLDHAASSASSARQKLAMPLEVGGGVAAGPKLWLVQDVEEQLAGGANALDLELVQRPLGARDRLLAVGSPYDQLGQQRVVERRHLVALVGMGVEPHARARAAAGTATPCRRPAGSRGGDPRS